MSAATKTAVCGSGAYIADLTTVVTCILPPEHVQAGENHSDGTVEWEVRA